MTIRQNTAGGSFTPEQINVMCVALDSGLRALRLVNRSDPVVEVIAKRIIELAPTDDTPDAAMTIAHQVIGEFTASSATQLNPPQSTASLFSKN